MTVLISIREPVLGMLCVSTVDFLQEPEDRLLTLLLGDEIHRGPFAGT